MTPQRLFFVAFASAMILLPPPAGAQPRVLGAPPAAAPAGVPISPSVPGLRVVPVDCSKSGQTIAKALQRPAVELVVEISGLCKENVVITRERVTLRGADPTLDGILAAGSGDPREAALTVRDTRRVRIENLALTGAGWTGLRVIDSHELIEAVGCRLEDNGQYGAHIGDSEVLLENVHVTGNGTNPPGVVRAGIFIEGAGRLTCNDCTVENNPAAGANNGIVAFQGAFVGLTGGSVEGGTALVALSAASIGTLDTDLTGSAIARVLRNSEVELIRGFHAGSLFAFSKSVLSLFGAEQTSSPAANLISRDSNLGLASFGGTPSKLAVDTLLERFSTGSVRGGSTVQKVDCVTGSDLFCDGTETKTSSTCGLCP